LRRTIVARSHQEILSLRFLWEQLEQKQSATMFQSFAWNYAASCAFPDREVPYVLYVENGSGTVLIPAAIRQNRLTLLGETLFDYRDALFAGDPDVLTSAWKRAAHLGLRFSAGAIRSDTSIKAWTGFDVSRFHGAPRVSPRETTDQAFAEAHGRLASGQRRLAREGVEFRSHTGLETALMHFIYQQKGSQPAESGDNLFADPRRAQFMVDLGRTIGNACEIFTYETAGTLVAALVTFRDRNVRRFYTVYCDRRWSRCSPGIALIYEVTKRSLRAGLECDYMTGEQAYKLRFSTSVVPMYWAEATADALAWIGQPIALVA
jgi:CelD/BcsL family acetyltransferase involved in cellulose biosynthesis